MAGALGSLTVKLGLDVAEYQAGLDRAEYVTAKFSAAAVAKVTAVATIAARATGALVDAVKGAITALPEGINQNIEALDRLAKASDKFGLPVEDIQAFQYALQLAGKNAQQGEEAIAKFAVAFTKARGDGEGQEAKLFRSLGVNVREFAADAGAALEATIDKVAQIGDAASRVTLERGLFGESATGISGAFEQGAASMRGARDELEAFGVLARGEAAQGAAALKDDLERLSVAGGALKLAITEAIVPTARAFVAALVDMKKESGSAYEAIRKFGQEDTLITWAESAALAVARAVEQLVAFGRQAATAIDQMNIFRLRSEDAIANSFLTLKSDGILGVRIGINDRSASERERISRDIGEQIAGIEKDIAERAGRAEFRIADRVAEFFAKVREKFANPGEARRRAVTVDLQEAFGKEAKKDPFADFLLGLEQERLKLGFSIENWDKYRGNIDAAKEALVEFELNRGRFSNASRAEDKLPALTGNQRDQALELARQITGQGIDIKQRSAIQTIEDTIAVINLETEALRKSNVEREVALKLNDLIKLGVSPTSEEFRRTESRLTQAILARERGRDVVASEEFARAERNATDAILFEVDALNRAKTATEELRAIRDIDTRIEQATKNADGTDKVTSEGRLAFLEAGDEAKRRVVDAIRVRVAAERDGFLAIARFARDYVDEVSNAARNANEALGAITKGLEDQLVKLFETGKFGWEDMLKAWQAELNRFVARKVIAQVFEKTGLSGADGAGVAFNALRLLNPGSDSVALADGTQFGNQGTDTSGQQLGTVVGLFTKFMSLFGVAGAVGGSFDTGRWHIAGEQGPEIIMPKVASTALTMGQFSALAGNADSGGGASPVVVQNISYQVQGALSRDTQDQTALRSAAAAQRALRKVN